MHDQILYVPILKGKANDLKAFARLDPKARLRTKPLVEVLPVDRSKHSTDEHLQVFADRLRKLSPPSALFLDFFGLMPDEVVADGTNAIVQGFGLLKRTQHVVTPVFGLGRNDKLWKPFGRIVQSFGNGFCFRIALDDMAVEVAEETWEQVIQRSSEFGLQPDSVDLVFDLGFVGGTAPGALKEQVVDFIALNPRISRYRSLAVVGSSALKEVSSVPKDGVGEVSRVEWHLWGQLHADVDDALFVRFGDYGIVHPDFSESVRNPNIQAKIRYTVGDVHLYARGHGLYRPVVDFQQYYRLAGKIAGDPRFQGRGFSFGDEYLHDRSLGLGGTGHLGPWICVDTNHHITYATHQIAKLLPSIRTASSSRLNQILAAV